MWAGADEHGIGCIPPAHFQTGSSIPQFNCLFAIYLNLFKDDLQDIMKINLKDLYRSVGVDKIGRIELVRLFGYCSVHLCPRNCSGATFIE